MSADGASACAMNSWNLIQSARLWINFTSHNGNSGGVGRSAKPRGYRSPREIQTLIDPAAAGDVLQDFARGQEPGSVLTERELEVLRRLARGLTN